MNGPSSRWCWCLDAVMSSLEALPNEFEVRGGEERRERTSRRAYAAKAGGTDAARFQWACPGRPDDRWDALRRSCGGKEPPRVLLPATRCWLTSSIAVLILNHTILVVIDGAKAVHKAVSATLGARILIHRCHAHM